MSRALRIAVIGGGVAGIAAAELLQARHEVTLYEASASLGGHAHPVRIDDPGAGPLEVDTAFLIFNRGSYPLFLRLLARWGLEDAGRLTEMSFGIRDTRSDLCYAIRGDWASMLSPTFVRILPELLRFRRLGIRDLRAPSGAIARVDAALGRYLAAHGFTERFIEHFILPLACSIWSVPRGEALELPARSFLAFFDHHGYLGGNPERRWMYLDGSSRRYLDAFARAFRGTLRLSDPVSGVRALAGGGAEVESSRGGALRYDRAVLATHADQALALLREPTPLQRELLGPWRYFTARALLHTDCSVLPPSRRHWASWNVSCGQGVTYWLNRVQRLKAERDYFVTLSGGAPRPESVLREIPFEHPVFDSRSVATQARLGSLNDGGPLLFCGSYFGYGFHEDAIRSAAAAAMSLGSGWD